MTKRQRRIAAGIALFVSHGLMAPCAVPAQVTITVDSTADIIAVANGECTLREAIANVNAAADTTAGDCVAGSGGGDTIDFALSLPAMIDIRRGALTIARDVVIVGASAGSLYIDGRHRSRIFTIAEGTASLSDLIIQNGRERAADGAGILVQTGATLILTRCTLNGNKAAGIGGAIANRGTTTLHGCALMGNGALGGGGLGNVGGEATLTGCSLARNKGGGIANFTGTLTMNDCTLELNKAFRFAGGGLSNLGGTATLTACTFSHNQSFTGGALDNFGGTVSLTTCTFSRNSATRIGGILNSGNATLINCTVSRNRASRGLGGGMFNSGIASLTDCTVTNNTVPRNFGGAQIYNVGATTVTNTTLAGDAGRGNCAGTAPISGGHNLSNDGTCFSDGATDQ